MSSLIVVKRDGTREPWRAAPNLERGIWVACTKRPVSQKAIDDAERTEEKKGQNREEVESSAIGKDVSDRHSPPSTKSLHPLCMVHREFKDVEEFKKELGSCLVAKKKINHDSDARPKNKQLPRVARV